MWRGTPRSIRICRNTWDRPRGAGGGTAGYGQPTSPNDAEVDLADSEPLPDCSRPGTWISDRARVFCEGLNPQFAGWAFERVSAALDDIAARSSTCAAIAAKARSVLDAGHMRFFPYGMLNRTSEMGVVKSCSGGVVMIGIRIETLDEWYPTGGPMLPSNNRLTLTRALAHEGEHYLNRNDQHVSGDGTQTTSNIACGADWL